MTEVGDALANVRSRVLEAASSRGFKLADIAFTPGPAHGERLIARIAITLDEDWAPKSEEDLAFEQVIESAKEAEALSLREQRAEEARKSLEGMGEALRNPDDGIGL